MQKKNLPSIQRLSEDFPSITFCDNSEFYWSAENQTVYYNKEALTHPEGVYRLLHEIGHAISGHTNYTSGIQLIRLEAQAWSKAQEIAANYDIKITDEIIEDCLDTYRDWLHLRSSCPHCKIIAVETSSNTYHCFNCFSKWTVPKNQRSRHYRLKLPNLMTN